MGAGKQAGCIGVFGVMPGIIRIALPRLLPRQRVPDTFRTGLRMAKTTYMVPMTLDEADG